MNDAMSVGMAVCTFEGLVVENMEGILDVLDVGFDDRC